MSSLTVARIRPVSDVNFLCSELHVGIAGSRDFTLMLETQNTENLWTQGKALRALIEIHLYVRQSTTRLKPTSNFVETNVYENWHMERSTSKTAGLPRLKLIAFTKFGLS